MLRRIAFVLAALVVLGAALPGGGPVAPAVAAPDIVAGEVLVKFKPGASAADEAEVHRRNGGAVKKVLPRIEVNVVGVPAGQEQARAAAYALDPRVEFAEANGRYHALDTYPNDPQYVDQWQYNNSNDADIDAPEAWAVTTGSSVVLVAVLDSGIDDSHEDLAGRFVAPLDNGSCKNFIGGTTTCNDVYGHGTHVAGTIGAATNNALGVAGTCPSCRLLIGKVLDDGGSGPWSDIASGVTWAADYAGVKVINLSIGGGASSTMESAVNYAWSKGVVVVASAGNSGNSDPTYPAYYTNVIAVAATDATDAKWSSSDYGAWVDVAAPGVNVLSSTSYYHTGTRNGYGTKTGTSMSAPHVAGIAGLVWSTSLCATNTCVRGRIEDFADPIAGTGTYWAHGRANACRSVGGTCTAPAPPALPKLSIADASALEGNKPNGTNLSFPVTLDAGSSQTVTVQYATVDGTAKSGSKDYVSTSGTLTFSPGQTARSFTVRIRGDTTVEPDESFSVNLSNPTNATFADGQGLGTIVNDDR
jgi:thermitase